MKFIKIIDRLFDLLNSRNPFGKEYKQPITKYNLPYLKIMVEDCSKYLFQLKSKENRPLHLTARKTFIYGFIVSAQSVWM